MTFLLSQITLLLLLLSPGEDVQQAHVTRGNFHPYHVSVTELQHNTAENSLEVNIKFFTEDFEKTLEKANRAKLDITASRGKEMLDKYIPAYINNHLQLTGDGKLLKLEYVGYEVEKESVFCYFEVTDISSVTKIDVSNSLLYDLTKEQLNIMHFTMNGKRVSKRLSFPATKASFVF